ncbi:MAG: UDP-N-acetylglucosamine 2-epimerase (hydrolyzing) [bacterium]|nr:UDP-N-acetylglucosamine 2-epimerase (hydrolyzing) [bacterium]
MRRIAVVTGTRAEYGILKPVLYEIASSENMKPYILPTGMHLSPEYGLTIKHIEEDGFPITARVDMLFSSDSRAAMAKGLGVGLIGLTQEIERIRPHAVLVLGDRVEAFAGAIAGLFCGAAVGHLHGGDVTRGGLDEYMRHAITKLSHLHFAATEKSKSRILKLGECEDFVYQVGTPGLDALLKYPQYSDQELSEKLGVSIPGRFVLVVQHPISTHPETAVEEINETISALKFSGVHTFLIYPNSDAGSRDMIASIRAVEHEPWLDTFVSMPRELYCNLLRRCACLVGNSSSGMIDAPAYGVPVINVGERQEGRERGDNVIDVAPVRSEIEKALNRALTDENFILRAKNAVNPYGDGKASERISQILETVDFKRARSCKRLPW